MDYYKLLKIDQNASLDQIQFAYKIFVLKWNQIDIDYFRAVSGAYDVLSNDVKKVQYDGARISSRIISLEEAWEIYIKFVLSNIHEEKNIVRLIDTLGISSRLITYGENGGIAISAITAALLYNKEAVSIYKELKLGERVAFQQGIIILSKFLH